MESSFKTIINKINNIVFFGGAGVSTESGIPDFRSADGLYNQSYLYPPETILSHSFFIKYTTEFYKFYREKIIQYHAKPNITHTKLAELEKQGKLKAIITQNIDGLHQTAGSLNVIELHGSIHRNYCTTCQKSYTLSSIKNSTGIPTCTCGGTIKPDVVLYEEPLHMQALQKACQYITEAETLIVAGTSLNVYPAAGLLQYYRGENLIVINLTKTKIDCMAKLIIHKKIGDVFSEI